jgi:general secretion pathway protein H
LNPGKKGFTLIELVVVVLLIGLTMVLSVPRLRYAMLTDDLRGTVRRMVGTVRTLRNEAIREQKVYALHFDLESNRLWADSADMTDEERIEAHQKAFQLPKGVRVLDVWRSGKGKEVAGEAVIRFTKKGYMEQSVIHLGAEDGRRFTLIFSPFLGRVKVLEEYIEFVDI